MSTETIYRGTIEPGELFDGLPPKVQERIVNAFLDSNGVQMATEIRGVSHVDAVATVWRWNRLLVRHCDEAAKAWEDKQ